MGTLSGGGTLQEKQRPEESEEPHQVRKKKKPDELSALPCLENQYQLKEKEDRAGSFLGIDENWKKSGRKTRAPSCETRVEGNDQSGTQREEVSERTAVETKGDL